MSEDTNLKYCMPIERNRY